MPRPVLLAILAIAQPCFGEVTFDWAYVGNAGNAADPETGFGAVSYNYAISKTEVTNAQYVEFLNAVDPSGANLLQLFNPQMAGNLGGIELQPGNPNGSRFVAQAGREQNPVTYVSFFDAMRFTNWLHNGQGSNETDFDVVRFTNSLRNGQGSSDTETGVYTIGSGIDEVRSAGARYWIPSEDEWYKAAYHDASAGTARVYFDYATGSEGEPVSDQPGDNAAAVNYFSDDGLANGINDGFAVSGSTDFPSNPFTDVGAYAAAASPYGTFDQSGNVQEWNETVFRPSGRGLRGGSWISGVWPVADVLSASNSTGGSSPTGGTFSVGFRVAGPAELAIPEPTTAALATLAITALAARRRP